MPDQLRKNTLYTYASSLFGNDNVHNQTRIVNGLPDGWTVRSMAGLEALSHLHHGSVVVLPDEIIVKGKSSKEDIKSIVSRIFSTRVDSNANYKTDVAFDENLVVKEDTHIMLSPEDCKKQVNAVLLARKIDFAPSSASIEEASLGVIDSIAEILKECPETKFEIGGHTDSQGSEETNATLSQGRADSVLQALLDRRVLTAKMISKGYGEAQPIADNATEQGRAQNRRIEFRLIEETIEDGQN
jgi:OOP family OmpA-OmpF porin